MDNGADTQELKHWYSFAYADGNCQASCYTGYDKQGVTLAIIKENKKHAGVRENSVLLSCCYLGEMTRAEFAGEGQVND